MKSIRQKVTLKTIFDLSLWSLAIPIAYALRLEMPVFEHGPNILLVMGIMLPVNGFLVYQFGLNRQSWHKVGVLDVYSLVKAIGISAGVLMGLAAGFRSSSLFIPYSVPFIELIVSFMLLFAARFSVRFWDEQKRKKNTHESEKKNILIVGAGEAGTLMAREMLRHPEVGMNPVGFLDDNPKKQSQKYLGLPVYGALNRLRDVATANEVDEVLIAVPSAPGKVVRKVVDMAREVEVNYKILPSLHELINGNITITEIRDVDMKDLLKREPVELDNKKISGYLKDRVVLITGAGGSIGSEVVRQVLKFNPSEILLVDQSEYNIYKIDQELSNRRTNVRCHAKILNIC
ncbi:MAG TPA: polysaccharide biosynthesis protein, partial [Fodinibius sp.]|nr:polysaccharide biosynthesis protein [Fodinibius sp.]